MSEVVKNPTVNAGNIRDASLITGSGRAPEGGHAYPLQYSCMENLMEGRTWQATVHKIAKRHTWLKQLSMHAFCSVVVSFISRISSFFLFYNFCLLTFSTWFEVCNIAQEDVTKTIPKKKKCKKAKCLSEEAFQIAEGRRELKGMGYRERYTQLNAEFQRIARRHKKVFLRTMQRSIRWQ